jgi:hypothetical protein
LTQYDDSDFFLVKPPALLEGIRLASVSSLPEDAISYILRRCGLIEGSSLTEAGQALFKLCWVLRKMDEAELALGQALRQLNPIQVIDQELRGLGAVPEDGVFDLFKQHSVARRLTSVGDMRPALVWLSKVKVISYSRRFKTIRSLSPAADYALPGEIQAIAAMVSPKTPYLNIVRLRRVLRSTKGTVWWADPHFGARALEELAEEIDTEQVEEIRILSGDAANVASERSLKDFKRFVAEMANKGVKAEWRVDVSGVRDWHDRWLVDAVQAWNVPPVNTLFKNDYSEILPASDRPPLQAWWDRSTSRT